MALSVSAADGRVVQATARRQSTVRQSWGEARYYRVEVDGWAGEIRVQLNGGDAGDDERRLAEIARDCLNETVIDDPLRENLAVR